LHSPGASRRENADTCLSPMSYLLRGLAARFSSGAAIALGGEYGGIGNNVHIWTYHVRAAVPF
jgi:hypothetical protein